MFHQYIFPCGILFLKAQLFQVINFVYLLWPGSGKSLTMKVMNLAQRWKTFWQLFYNILCSLIKFKETSSKIEKWKNHDWVVALVQKDQLQEVALIVNIDLLLLFSLATIRGRNVIICSKHVWYYDAQKLHGM